MSGAWLLSLALLFACAYPERPPGGPEDVQPPWLVAATPESASAGHGAIDELRFGFSEKMRRDEAYKWLTTYPRRVIESTSWSGARVAEVRLEEPLPADTTVVIELAPGMRDAHEVVQPRGRTFVFATGDSIADGVIRGALVLDDEPLGRGVAEIIAAGPDTVRLEQRPVLRRAVADSGGRWALRWLPADGESWLLRTYDDRNDDRRPGENEAQRLWPDTLHLTPGASTLDLGVRVLYGPQTPGTLVGELATRPDTAGTVFGFTRTIAESDTGFVPGPVQGRQPTYQAVPDTGRFTLTGAGPGLVRAVFFVDQDGDSTWSAVGAETDTLWALEPWGLVDSVTVEPGLEATIPSPAWSDTLTPWPAPARLPADTTAAEADTLAADVPDTSLAPEQE
ncbi:hypothetical protein GF314_07835 [bacterium]|nr:hypothetical protein [bacterium]